MGVIKLAEAANITQTKNGVGSKFKLCAMVMAIGAVKAAVALFDIISVSIDVAKYNPEITAIGPKTPKFSTMLLAIKISKAEFFMATPILNAPANKKTIFQFT